ncbi:hypothetical protein ACGFLS_32440 [Streptomyces abikoensis]|uniref:hypothetical protein n=1 Tax=Streptomyces abikoensis TaxID=97398 RepID=UPI00372018F2
MVDEAAEMAEAIRALEGPGARRVRLKLDLREVDKQLKPLVARAVQADVPVRRIAEITGLSTNTVMLWGRS